MRELKRIVKEMVKEIIKVNKCSSIIKEISDEKKNLGTPTLRGPGLFHW